MCFRDLGQGKSFIKLLSQAEFKSNDYALSGELRRNLSTIASDLPTADKDKNGRLWLQGVKRF